MDKTDWLPGADDRAVVMDGRTQAFLRALERGFEEGRVGVMLRKDPDTGEVVRVISVDRIADDEQVLSLPVAIIHNDDYLRKLTGGGRTLTGEEAKEVEAAIRAKKQAQEGDKCKP